MAASDSGHRPNMKGMKDEEGRLRGDVNSGEGAGGIVEGSVKMPL